MKSQKATETILVLVLFQVVVFLLTRINGWLYGAICLGVLAMFIPALANKIHYAWMKLATALGFVMGRVLLTIIFFFVLVPLSLLSKLFSKNSIELKAKGRTTFKERNFTYTPESFENVW